MGVIVGKTGNAAVIVGDGFSGVADIGSASTDAVVGVADTVAAATVVVTEGANVVGGSAEAQGGGGNVGGMSVASSVGSVPSDDPAIVCPAFRVIASI